MSSPRTAAPSATSRLVIVDAANTLYRAFFAIPPLRTSGGVPTNAVYGFVNMLNKVLREERPDHVVVVFDAPGPTFRDELYADYKATRDAQPEDLGAQIPLVREIVEAWGLPLLEVPGFEADDVIATLVARAPEGLPVTIVSTDKDLMQLVSDRVVLLDTMKDRRFGPAEVEARFGVPPARVLDLRALVGDPSDNIPGVKGIGEKGAAQLISQFGDLENLLAHVQELPAKRAREALSAQAEQARLSKRLATLDADVPLPLDLDALRLPEPDRERLRTIFRRLEFSRLADALDDAGSGAAPRAAQAVPRTSVETRVIESAAALAELVEELASQDCVAMLLLAADDGDFHEDPTGLAFALDASRAAYVPIVARRLSPSPPLAFEVVLDALRGLLTGPQARPWLGRDAKFVQALFAEHGLELAPARCDVELAGFLLDPAAAQGTVALAAQLLGTSLQAWEELAGRGARALAPGEVPLEEAAAWASAHVCSLRALAPLLVERLERDGLRSLFEDVELPLSAVLARMERAGVRVDENVLAQLSRGWNSELARIEAEIYSIAGERFQIASPKQLQRILFEKLKLPIVRKTKTGYSTDESVLEQLAAHHELPARILAHRRLSKLKSTYVDALPPLVHRKTGRIHPTFHQTGAATGRLSCTHPNLQNIPIRSEEGVRIREAFVPAEGRVLLSADYSQVELRILAHYSGDASLIEAFRAGEDVHRRTAAEVLGVDPERVSADQRARAKAINFGIIYGSSAFGIANQLGIATAEAQATIDAYFARYQGVRRFLDDTIASARERGFVRTLLGRRRYLPDLGSRNRVMRSAAERMAVNTVIQGTAADLIKKAMVDVDAAIRGACLRTCMILQVHDELVFEAPEAEVEEVRTLVQERMEGVWALRVPLMVEIGAGRSWRAAH